MIVNRYRFTTCNQNHVTNEHVEDIDAIDVTGFFANIVNHTLYIKVEHDGTYEIFEHNVGPLVMLRQVVFELVGADGVYITEQPKDSTIKINERGEFDVLVNAPMSVTYQWQLYRTGMWEDISGAISSHYVTGGQTTARERNYRCTIKTQTGVIIYTRSATLTIIESEEQNIDPD